MNSRSPPPLQHPKPTRAAVPPPEPPQTPSQSTNSSPYSQAQRISQDGYMRYSSPPVGETSTHASGANVQGYTAPQNRNGYAASPNPPMGYASMGSMGGPGPGAAGGPAPYGSWPGMNDATTQMGVQFGKSAVAAGQEYVEKNASGPHQRGKSGLMAVHAVPPSRPDQNLLLSHQLLCPAQAAVDPLPVEAQALGAAGQAVRRGRRGRVAATSGRYQRPRPVHPQ